MLRGRGAVAGAPEERSEAVGEVGGAAPPPLLRAACLNINISNISNISNSNIVDSNSITIKTISSSISG